MKSVSWSMCVHACHRLPSQQCTRLLAPAPFGVIKYSPQQLLTGVSSYIINFAMFPPVIQSPTSLPRSTPPYTAANVQFTQSSGMPVVSATVMAILEGLWSSSLAPASSIYLMMIVDYSAYH